MKNIYTGNNVVITGEVNLSEDVSIWHNAVLRGDEGYITIGSRTNIQDLVMIHTGMPDYSVTIGHDTTIGHSAIIHGCTIGNECMIGMGAISMNGAKIGNQCIVAAGSIVTEHKTFPEKSLILGSPAKLLRTLTDDEIQKIRDNAEAYVTSARKQLSRN